MRGIGGWRETAKASWSIDVGIAERSFLLSILSRRVVPISGKRSWAQAIFRKVLNVSDLGVFQNFTSSDMPFFSIDGKLSLDLSTLELKHLAMYFMSDHWVATSADGPQKCDDLTHLDVKVIDAPKNLSVVFERIGLSDLVQKRGVKRSTKKSKPRRIKSGN